MSNPLIPAKPAQITLETLPQLFAHHRARFGGWSMDGSAAAGGSEKQNPPAGEQQPPARPDGVTEEEWSALSDPGRAALTRERDARQAAERALAATRARPAAPKNPPAAPAQPKSDQPAGGDQPDVAALIKQAVEAAIKPFTEREAARETQAAAERVQQVVLDAAKDKLHDATDALTGVDLASVVNDKGEADPAKVTTALEDLIKRKPHLAKATQRFAPPGIGGGAPAGATDGEKVKAVLADMQRATGVRPPSSTS